MRLLLEIEAVLSKKRVFDKFAKDYPSFSLGLSQMETEELSGVDGAGCPEVRF